MGNVLLVGDCHFGIKKDSETFLDYQLKFFDNLLFPYIEKNFSDIESIVLMGDVFDNRKKINVKTSSIVKERVFDRLWTYYESYNIPTYIIIGNHDIYYNQTIQYNSLKLLLDDYENITIIDRPFEVGNILMIPWLNPENQDTVLDKVKNTSCELLFGHLELEGFLLHGNTYSNEGLPKFIFDRFKGVYSGHIHLKQTQGNIHYVGTPYQLFWSDVGCHNGFHVLNTDSLRLSFHVNPHKIFWKYVVHKDTKLEDYSHFENSFVKIYAADNDKITLSRVDLILSKIKQYKLEHLEVIKPQEKELTESKFYDQSFFLNPEQYIEKYLLENIPESKKYIEEFKQICTMESEK